MEFFLDVMDTNWKVWVKGTFKLCFQRTNVIFMWYLTGIKGKKLIIIKLWLYKSYFSLFVVDVRNSCWTLDMIQRSNCSWNYLMNNFLFGLLSNRIRRGLKQI